MASDWATDVVERLQAAYETRRDPKAAIPMARYMRDQFPFLGLKSPVRREATREALAGIAGPTEADLAEVLKLLWALPEREYQYAGCELAATWGKVCGSGFIDAVEGAVVTKSWWDTVDSLASHVAGPLVRLHPGLTSTTDTWIQSDDFWLARTAILHQLRYKTATDTERLFRYCVLRAGDQEFFLRKAIGWALREYSKTDAGAVRAFVREHDSELSGLSKREALLWLNGGRNAKNASSA